MSDTVEPDGRDRVLPGDTSAPTWVLASTVFGLLALTGSITLLAIVASAVVIAWVSYAGRPDEGGERVTDHPFRGGLGGSGPRT
jgi:hypothetical protein